MLMLPVVLPLGPRVHGQASTVKDKNFGAAKILAKFRQAILAEIFAS